MGAPLDDRSAASTELRFGECADCGCQLERPFWDTVCFSCQDERESPDVDEWEATDAC